MTTTSVLSHLSDQLTAHDLQVVRDYAHEAPWEWRKVLEALCDRVETTLEIEDIDTVGDRLGKLDELEEQVDSLETEKSRLESDLSDEKNKYTDLRGACVELLELSAKMDLPEPLSKALGELLGVVNG